MGTPLKERSSVELVARLGTRRETQAVRDELARRRRRAQAKRDARRGGTDA